MATSDAGRILQKAFERIGAKPERLCVDVLLQKGGELKSIYVIPGRSEPYFSIDENGARSNLREGESLYKLDISRIE